MHADCPKPKSDCRVARCDKDIGCYEKIKPDGAICNDGDPCTKTDVCDQGDCKAGKAKICDDKDDCTVDSCDAKTGKCLYAPAKDGKPCDDKIASTVNDACKLGKDGKSVCVGVKTGCLKDDECKDDDDLCNGVLYCDKTKGNGTCVVNPKTIVKCATDKDTTCKKNVCAPKTGKCAMTAVKDGTACDDGQKCTANDSCKKGKCEAGKLVCCNTDKDCTGAEDGDPCNGTLYCDKKSGKCLVNPLTVVKCSVVKDDACVRNLCDKKKGACAMTPVNEGKPCDEDGNKCTPNDACKNGKCIRDSKNVCECKTDKDCAAKEDGDICNGTLFCDKTGTTPRCRVNEATRIACKTVDDTLCAGNRCQPKTGACKFVPLPGAATCDQDGNKCTEDKCDKGLCKDTGNVTCQCQKDSDCVPFGNGNACDGTLYCNANNTCALNPATPIACKTKDDGPCNATRCVPSSGKCEKKPLVDGTSCDADGNSCTFNDSCKAGVCKAGNNTCQCQQNADCKKLEDGSLCNGTLACDAKTKRCVVNLATVVKCSDWQDTECMKAACVPKTGKCVLQPTNQFRPCNADDNPCTPFDTCNKGQCFAGTNICQCQLDKECLEFDDKDLCTAPLYCDKKGGKPPFLCEPAPGKKVTCDDGKGCMTPRCDPKDGKCKTVPYADGKPCDDNDKCSQIDVCEKGVCKGFEPLECKASGCATSTCNKLTGNCEVTSSGNPCDDKNPCTDDSCDAAAGKCTNANNKAACNDGDVCTEKDICGAGTCKGTPKSCKDGNECTKDECNAKTGKCDIASAGPCLGNDKCVNGTCQGTVCKTTKVVCDDKQACTLDGCKAATGCEHTAMKDGAKCGDDKACIGVGTCTQGKCGGNQPKLWRKPTGTGAWDALLDVAWTSDAHIVGVGYKGTAYNKNHKAWWVRFTGDGKFVKEVTWTGRQYIRRAIAADSGSVLAVGRRFTKPLPHLNHKAWVARITTAGSPKWTKEEASENTSYMALAKLTDNRFAVVGFRVSGLNDHPILRRMDPATGADLAPRWTTPSGSKGHRRFEVVAAAPKGEIFAYGRWGTTSQARLMRFSAANNPLWERDFHFKKTFEVSAAAPTKSGGVAIAGKRTIDNVATLLQLSANGAMSSWVPYAKGLKARGTDVAALKNGALVAVAYEGTSILSIKKIVAAKITGDSLSGVTKTEVPKSMRGLRASVIPGAGLALAVIYDESQGVGRSWLIGADSWGRHTCSSAGVCFDKAMSTCDDSKDCTSDVCDPNLGCVYANTTSACDDGAVCTVVGSCSNGTCHKGKPKLATFEMVNGNAQVHGVTTAWDGDTVTAGTAWPPGKKSAGYIDLYGRGGAHVTRVTLSDAAEDTELFGVASDGKTGVVVGRRGSNGIMYNYRHNLSPLYKQRTYAAKSGSVVFHAAVRRHPGWMIAGDNVAGSTSKGIVVWWRLNTKVDFITTLGDGTDQVRLRAIVKDAAGSIYVAGDRGGAKPTDTRRPYLALIAKTNKVTWSMDLSIQPQIAYINSALIEPSGNLVLAGRTGQQATSNALFVLFDTKKKTPTFDQFGLPGMKGTTIRGITWHDGEIFAFGQAGQPPQQTRFLARIKQGKVAGVRAISRMTSPNHATAMAHRGDGLMTLVGYDQNSTTKVSVPFVAQVDGWGNTVCTGAGGCLLKPLTDCDDKKANTNDFCDGKTNKCVHE